MPRSLPNVNFGGFQGKKTIKMEYDPKSNHQKQRAAMTAVHFFLKFVASK